MQGTILLKKVAFTKWKFVLTDAVLMVTSTYISILLLTLGENQMDFSRYSAATAYMPVNVLIRIFIFWSLGVYSSIWRYTSLHDLIKLAKAIALSSIIILTWRFSASGMGMVAKSLLLNVPIMILLVCGARIFRRIVYEYSVRRHALNNAMPKTSVVVFGAGRAGRSFAAGVASDPLSGYRVLGFIDDDPMKVGYDIGGHRVLGSSRNLAETLVRCQPKEVIVAISRPPHAVLQRLLQVATHHSVRVKLLNENDLSDSTGFQITRKIELEDLLNRSSRNPDLTLTERMFRGKCVLITGAGGSIGSELSRQIQKFSPARLLLLDHSELNLYTIDSQLRSNSSRTDQVVPLLVDIKDKATLEEAFRKYTPQVVIHAAAYKHVHLVELNPHSTVLNNIQGTKNLVEFSKDYDVESFVQVSTDKAVNPVGIMGASKRICELIVSSAGEETGRNFCSVRFGNVLGSSGSLIPKISRQIDEGGPVTVTDPEMTRYFMLIPEAVSLVLRAATLARPGDIAVLRMGEPIKIVDVARNLIVLKGHSVDAIPIVFTGKRPGEKLFEELYLCGHEIITEDPDILIVPKGDGALSLSPIALKEAVARIVSLANSGRAEVVSEMHSLISRPMRGVSDSSYEKQLA